MTDETKEISVFVCPGGCKCACATGGACEHVWDGPTESFDTGACLGDTATCSRCGMAAIDHSLMVGP